jgi:hypothetical protein
MQLFDNVVCNSCKFLRTEQTEFKFFCIAFPDGIPKEILTGENDHTEPLPDQGNNIVYVLNDGIPEFR